MEDFEMEKSKVYIKIDDKNRVTRCEGGYTTNNIENFDEWLLIDEGHGDKFNLCQSHYFEKGLFTEDDIPRYKWDGEKVVKRSNEEVTADRENRPAPAPTTEEDLMSMAIDHEYRLTLLELGVE